MAEAQAYDFWEQRSIWKKAEKLVFEHLLSKKNTITVTDYSLDKKFQDLWIDGMYVYENEHTWIVHSMFFDVKADSRMHKKDTIFVETASDNSETEKKWDWILSTKAEYFLYYDPVLWRLFWIPVFPFRDWYNAHGVSKVHLPVKDTSWKTTEGIVVSIEELTEYIPFIEIETWLKKMEV